MMMKIGEVFCLIRNGASIKQSDGASGIPITRIETISNRIVDRNKFGYANISNASEYQDYLLQDGDILMSHINSEKHLGKTALYRKYSGEQIIHGMNLLLLRPNAEILLADYAMYILNSEMFLRQLPRITKKSVNQASFNISALKELDVYIPSINRQKEIVSVLDKVDAMLERYKTQFKRLDDLVKSRFVEMFGEPVTNSHGYEQVTIGNACTLINGRAFKPSEWGEKGLPIVRIQNLNDMNASFNYYAGEVSEQHLIDNGMLLFSWSGTPGTSFGAFMWNRGPGALNQHIFKVIPKLDFDLDYLRYAMNGQLTTIIEKAHGGVGLQHITKAELEKICLLHPEMAEQKRFAAFAKQVDK